EFRRVLFRTESNNITEDNENTVSEDNSNHSQNEKKNALNDIADQTLGYILNIIKEMNINVEGSYKIKSNTLYIDMSSDQASYIIGKIKQVLNALQTVIQNYMHQYNKENYTLILDIESYRAKRKETLEQLAINMAKKAKQTKRPVKLE